MNRTRTRLHKLQYIGKDVPLRAEERRAGEIPLHSHDYFELEILLKGEGNMQLNDHRYDLRPGSVYFLTPADFHKVSLSAENRLWNISFDGSMVDRSEQLFSENIFFRQVDLAVLHRLSTAAQLLSEESDFERQKLLVEYLLRGAGIRRKEEEPLSPIRRAVLYAETYFRENPSLGEIAANVGLSPSYFGALFREEMGETYVSYLNRRKINCAVMLLKNGKSVTEACFASGFGSLSGFRYVFQQNLGMSPKDFSIKETQK